MTLKKILVSLLCTAALRVSANAADKPAAGAPDAAVTQMMQQMEKYGSPGEQHKILEAFMGKWTHTVRSWMKPGDKPMESQGTGENTWIFGGRFLKMEAKGQWAGKEFEGLGYTGYDNVRGEYQSVWFDNMSTGIMKGSGSYDPAAKTLKQSGHFSCPATGEKEMWYRSEWKIVNKDKNIYTSYGKGPDGKEFKAMEITYTRAK